MPAYRGLIYKRLKLKGLKVKYMIDDDSVQPYKKISSKSIQNMLTELHMDKPSLSDG